MADPQAVMRAAGNQKPSMGGMSGPPGGMPPGPDAPPAGPGGPSPAPGGDGLDTMVQNLQSVGEFLKSKGPAAQEAMGLFQNLLQAMGEIGAEGAPAPEVTAPEAPKGNGRIHESQQPGVQVL